MAQTAAKYAGTVAEDASAGTTAWTNPTNAQGSNDSTVAVAASAAGGVNTRRLKATNFGFTTSDIPTGSTINGFIIRTRVRGGTNNRAYMNELFVVKGGTTQTGATNLGEGSGTTWSNSLTNRSYGGASQKFGLSWSDSDVRASNFGLSLQAGRGNTTTVECAWFEVIVDYTTPVTHATSGALTGQGSTVVGAASLIAQAPSNTYAIVNNTNTTVAHVGAGVYEIEKTAGTNGAFDADAVSSASASGDFVLRLTPLVITNELVGVNSDPTADSNYTSIDFAVDFTGLTTFSIYESGVQISTLNAVSTYAWIWRTGTTLGYGSGATLAAAQASPYRTTTSSAALYFDSSLNATGARVAALFYEIPVVDHATTGSLVGAGSTVSGASVHNKPHPSTGALTGQGSTVVGSAAHIAKHATSGVLTGQGSALSGTAARARQHAATGVLTGAGSTVAGSAARLRAFAATGVLSGQGSALDGATARFRAFDTSGALTGAGSIIAGDATKLALHSVSGSPVGQIGGVTASAARIRAFAASGDLTGQGSVVAGTAARERLHEASGVLSGPGATITGDADRATSASEHSSTGALSGQGPELSGSAARVREFIADAALVGLGATVAGDAARIAIHDAAGALIGVGSSLDAAAARFRAIAASGALEGQGAEIIGQAILGQLPPVPANRTSHASARLDRDTAAEPISTTYASKRAA